MKQVITLTVVLFSLSAFSFAGEENTGDIKMLRDPANIDSDLRDILFFMDLEYIKVDFEGKGLTGKSYTINAYEIWNGEATDTSTVFNSSEIPAPHLQRIMTDSFQIRVVSELTDDNTLRMHFNFPGLTVRREYDAVQSTDYSLRYASMQPEADIKAGEPFYLLTYILPYEKDGIKHYCSVEASGSDIFSWGEEFDIEHYLVFEMMFDEM